jgi:hypothetical protein
MLGKSIKKKHLSKRQQGLIAIHQSPKANAQRSLDQIAKWKIQV